MLGIKKPRELGFFNQRQREHWILEVALREGNAYLGAANKQDAMDYNYHSYQTQSPCIRVIRSAQNLSVCLRASLFCLCLNAVASYLMQQLSLKGITARLDPSLWGMMPSRYNGDNYRPPFGYTLAPKKIGCNGFNLFTGVRVLYTQLTTTSPKKIFNRY